MKLKHYFERRQSQRLVLNRLVIVKEITGKIQKLVGVNYSAGGMALNSTKPLSFGEFVDLQFWLTEPENKEINMTAEVLDYSKQGAIYINSMKFVGQLAVN